MNSGLLEITCIAHHYGTACTQGMAVWSKHFSHLLTFFKCEGNHRVDMHLQEKFLHNRTKILTNGFSSVLELFILSIVIMMTTIFYLQFSKNDQKFGKHI